MVPVADALVLVLGLALTLGLSLIVGVGVGLVGTGCPYTFRAKVTPSQLQSVTGSDMSSTVCSDSSVIIIRLLLRGPPAAFESVKASAPLTFRVMATPDPHARGLVPLNVILYCGLDVTSGFVQRTEGLQRP